MSSSVITRKSQVTIPKAIREQVRLEIGDRVTFVVRDGEIVIKPPARSLLEMQGSVEPRRRPEDFDAVRRSARRRRAERWIDPDG
ncbi:MAG: AbrB/MazE/SpoVT family DNA-binding domain-containing protein [Holophagales bacterium]|nr:AbrB/MazE/SpoVT family DNA-binding domain-containing protein [Holophagales bacterium]